MLSASTPGSRWLRRLNRRLAIAVFFAVIAGTCVAPAQTNLGRDHTSRCARGMAEGTIGAEFVEFWPDISRRLFKKHQPAP
jgi:hypothetical protein